MTRPTGRRSGLAGAAGFALLACVAIAPGAHADVTISGNATQNMSCSGGICEPTAADANLNVTDLENLLAAGSTAVTTTGSGVQATNIDLEAALFWSAASTLSLHAQQSITISQPVEVAGRGGLSLLGGRKGGAILFNPVGTVSFQDVSSSLSIDGKRYRLETDLSRLIRDMVVHPGAAYALAGDYDAHGKLYRTSVVPVPFSGRFNGLGHSISHFEIADESGTSVGFFASLEAGASVASIVLDDVSIYGVDYVGGITGTNSGTISNASIRGKFIRGEIVGGIAGVNDGAILYCNSQTKKIATSSFAGGIAGQNGGEQSPTVTIDQSFASGKIVGGDNVETAIGGLVGINSGDSIGYAAIVTDSYATADLKIQGGGSAGGVVGYNPQYSKVTTSYSTGAVGGYGSQVGGFAGNNAGTASSSYWDTTTSGTSQAVGTGNSTGITGLTTEQLQSGLPPGFDPQVWAESPSLNNGLPYLIANPPPA